ncbi:Protein of unknown function [Cognatiyoonia koreensis]|uniref:AsmA-like C-terminal region n=1 Tax=Cognatiyoonia koreensis TaxID=364200 RepID=A0A1I0PN93_9RHOB|nr:DUF3971 domain-containing protein [Cognatiyoonia koreensis]SEW15894.1 Protein of unknown function [Cognatiyoonia koreensis]
MTDSNDAVVQDLPTPKKGRGRKAVHHSLRAIWLLATIPFAVVLLLSILLIDNDVTAPSWVKNRVQERAALILAGGSVEFGEITINVGRDLHPRVKLTATTLRDAEGAVLAEIDEIAGLMSPRGLFFERAALMQEIDLTGVDVSLKRAADGTVALAFDRDADALGNAPNLTTLIEQSEAVFDRPALQAMEQVRINQLGLIYEDARAKQTWTIDGGQLALDLRNDVTRVTGDLPLNTSETPASIDIVFESPRNSTAADLLLRVANIAASDLATQSPAISWMSGVDASLTAELSTGLDDRGQLLPLTASLNIGSGVFRPEAGATPVTFDGADIALVFDPARNLITFDQLDLHSDRGAFTGQGQAIAQNLTDGIPETFLGQFQFTDLQINPPGIYELPLLIETASVDLRLQINPFVLEIGQAVIDDARIMAIGKGHAAATPEGWIIALDIRGDRLDNETLHRLWPQGTIPRTREWFVNNLTTANYRDLTFSLRSYPGSPTRSAAGFGFEDATIQFMRTMPRISDGAGYVSLANNRFAVSLDKGRVIASTGGALDIAGSTLVIADVTRKENEMSLNLISDSAITAALSILDQEPFQFLSKANRAVTLADGRALINGTITFPLGRRPEPGETQFDIAGTLRRVSSDSIIPNRTLTGGTVLLRATNTQLRFEGAVSVDGVPVVGSYTLPIGPAANGKSRVEADIELSPQFLDAFNIGLPPGSVAGTGRGRLEIDLARGAAPAFSLTSNLQGIQLALPPIGWSKSPTAQGRLRVAGRLGPVPSIDTLDVGGGGLSASGAITFNDNGTLNAARFSEVQLDNWLNAPITLRGRGAGRPVAVEIAGGVLDLRRARFGPGGQGGGPMSIALDRLQITDGIALTAFAGDFDGSGGFSGQFQGRVNGAAVVQGTVAPRNGRSAVRLVSNDAGGVVRAAGFMRNAIGGTLDLTLLPAAGEGTFDGTLAVRNLRVKDAPAMAALLDAISVVGLLQQLDGQGLAFDAVDANFRLTPRQVVLTQSSAVGPGLGISLDGIYTLSSKSVDFQGVVSPFYLVNQIGSILTRRGEGLIGFNFNIAGTVDNPAVSVNPLSALTPGMFREIFRRAPPEVTE